MGEREYPEDEFDRLAAQRTVVSHREPESNRAWWLAALAIVVLVPVIGWAFVHFGGADSTVDRWPTQQATTEAPAPSEPESSEPADDDSASASATSSDGTSVDGNNAEDGGSTASDVDKDAEVRLLNGSRINGFAASNQEILSNKGFTNIQATNYQGGAAPQNSTVYYASESDEATAKEVASTLGISDVVLSPESVVGGEGIVVVLRSDIAS